jgi:hypothetical protein
VIDIGVDEPSHNDDAQSSCLCPYVRCGQLRRADVRPEQFRNPHRCFPNLEPNPLPGVSGRRSPSNEAGLKSELQRVRAMAEARIKSGSIPDWSWQQHVQLIEAVDAMLHDISLAESALHGRRYSGGPLRLVTDNPERPGARRKTGSVH